MNAEQKTNIAVDVFKAAPPVSISGLTLAGVSLQEWVLLTTLVYTVIMIVLEIRKAIRNWKK
jgi:hypothetical protein